MWFSTLTYSVEQPYRLRWITEIFYFGSTILILLLIVFNVALVGYDEVTVLQKDPNITDHGQWWAPRSLPDALRFRTTPGDCQATTLPLNTPLRTNSSLPLFTYNIINNLEDLDAQKDAFGLRSETPYQANPMNICRVENMTITMEARILAFVIETTLICDPVGQPPRARRFQTQFKHLIRLMYLRKVTLDYLGDTESPRPPELGYIVWDSSPDSRPSTAGSRLIDWETYAEGEWHFWGQYMIPMNVTITNLFVAIRDAIYLDIGNIAPSNIYANKTAFNDMIKVDEYGMELNQIMFEHGNWTKLNADPFYTWGWGNTSNVNITWAQAFTSTSGLTNNITLPIGLPANRTASVIDIDYLCPQYKMKSWGNLLMSVFVGTLACMSLSTGYSPGSRQHLIESGKVLSLRNICSVNRLCLLTSCALGQQALEAHLSLPHTTLSNLNMIEKD
ncbi:hypothetical protein RhiJN_12680 [Ceratobasidium sp. AG-Ba]|nr:hypothetical protein RhiJN_12680 [Ceratobasidium sp. AG-Ba]